MKPLYFALLFTLMAILTITSVPREVTITLALVGAFAAIAHLLLRQDP